MTQIKLLKHQAEFIKAKEKFVMLSAGVGAGKSFSGSWFVIVESCLEPDIPGLITANTYRQLQNVSLLSLFRECDKAGINYNYNSNRGILEVEGCKWFTYSLDNYNNIRGIEVGKFWGDEMRDADREAFLVMLSRLRFGKNLKGRITSTPSGFDYLYEYFVGDKKTDEFRLINATTLDNPYLPDSYIDTLKSSYDEKFYDQEVLGKFVNISTGRIYYAFDRKHHVDSSVDRLGDRPIHVGMDFNVDPMTAVIGQVVGENVIIFDEIYLNNSNTPEMAEVLLKRYGRQINIIPDYTGKKRVTAASGSMSDHEVLRGAGFKVTAAGNPFRMDRYSTVNNLLSKGRLKINPRCQKLIKDLEQVGYKEGSTMPDTGDKYLTHISDALGYLCWWAFPILPPKLGVQVLKR